MELLGACGQIMQLYTGVCVCGGGGGGGGGGGEYVVVYRHSE